MPAMLRFASSSKKAEPPKLQQKERLLLKTATEVFPELFAQAQLHMSAWSVHTLTTCPWPRWKLRSWLQVPGAVGFLCPEHLSPLPWP